MNTFSNIANFNGQIPKIDPKDATMLLIDHQSGLFQVVKGINLPQLRANVTALAKAARLLWPGSRKPKLFRSTPWARSRNCGGRGTGWMRN
ncbi:MAG: hypothetical protein ACREMA_19240, partial [Longimicrobiales bacterium]